ncbi:MAG: hypothetical protein J6Q30_01925 [Oscillospiraceae bacterium]|nr:hypothetical protein [Oscillospiraceae bacterium]
MKKKTLWNGSHEYTINGVRYVVDSCFISSKEKSNATISQRFERIVTSHVAPLTVDFSPGTMAAEYACSVAGKED